MEGSILISTKKVINLAADYTAFDLDVITFINSAFSTLVDLGYPGFMIEDDTATWDQMLLTPEVTNMIKTYVFLRVRMLFDPPQLSFVIEAMNKQIQEHEWRLNVVREIALRPLVIDPSTGIGTVYPPLPTEETVI